MRQIFRAANESLARVDLFQGQNGDAAIKPGDAPGVTVFVVKTADSVQFVEKVHRGPVNQIYHGVGTDLGAQSTAQV